MNTRAWPILCVLVAAGCKHTEPMTEEKFCQEYAGIECGKISAFCSFPAASCEPVRVQVCRATAQSFRNTGHQFNPDNTDACLKKLTEAFQNLPIPPQRLRDVDDACARVFAGNGKVTDPCNADFDCAGGLICDKQRCGMLKVVPANSGCANIGERCPADQFCTNDNPNMLYMCMPRLPEGSPCSLSRPCGTNLRCTGSCVRKMGLNMPCAEDDDCDSGYCDPYRSTRSCGVGLTFAAESLSCQAYTSPDAGVPSRGSNEVADAGADSSGTD